MKVSVIVPTNRVGGLDVLFSGLARQTHRDFEVFLVDDLPAVADRSRTAYFDFGVCHIAPHGIGELDSRLVEPGHYQRAINTAIRHANGDIALILCDYTWLAPDCLARHVAFYESHTGPVSLMGQVNHVKLPPLHPDFPRRYGFYEMGYDPATKEEHAYAPWLNEAFRMRKYTDWLAAYERDLADGTLDPFMWSVFAEPVTPETDVETFQVYQFDKSELPPGKVANHQLVNLKNNSFRLEDLRAVGGMNEAMDRCHVHQDSELAGRLQHQLGVEFYLDHSALAYFFDPHGIAIIRGMDRPERANLELYSAAYDAHFQERVRSPVL